MNSGHEDFSPRSDDTVSALQRFEKNLNPISPQSVVSSTKLDAEKYPSLSTKMLSSKVNILFDIDRAAANSPSIDLAPGLNWLGAISSIEMDILVNILILS